MTKVWFITLFLKPAAARARIAALTTAILLLPSGATGPATATQADFEHGKQLVDSNRNREALTFLNGAIARDPYFASLHNLRGLATWRLGNFREGLDDFNEALRLSPTYHLVHFNRALLYHRLGEYDLALSDVNDCLLLNPEYTHAIALGVFVNLSLGRGAAAAGLAERGLEVQGWTRPENGFAFDPHRLAAFAAVGYRLAGEESKAQAILAEALRHPTSERWEIEVLLYLKGDLRKEELLRRMEAAGKGLVGHFFVGWQLSLTGNLTAAEAHLQKLAKLDSDWEPVVARARIADLKEIRPVLVILVSRLERGFTPDDWNTAASDWRVDLVPYNSPAEGAGLRRGDVITAIGGEPLIGASGPADRLKDYRVGEAVTITILRDGNSRNINLPLSAARDSFHGLARAEWVRKESGILAFTEPDLPLAGAFTVQRSYNSAPELGGDFGPCWGADWEGGLSEAEGEVAICFADHSVVRLRRDRDGVYRVPGSAAELHRLDGSTASWRYRSATGGEMRYDREGRPLTALDVNGTRLSYRRDANGALTAIVVNRPGRGEQTYKVERDQFGRIKTIAGGGARVRYDYDRTGFLVGMRADDGWSVQYVYDDFGILTHRVDGNLAHAYFKYDGEGRVEKVGAPGALVKFAHERGATTVSDAEGRTTTYRFSARRQTTTDAAGDTSVATFDAEGKPATTTLPTGLTITWDYYPDGRPSGWHDNLGRSEVWTWDGARLDTVTDALNRTRRYRYDERGALKSTIFPGGREVSAPGWREGAEMVQLPGEGYQWLLGFERRNASGLLTSLGSDTATLVYHYDAAGRCDELLTRETRHTFAYGPGGLLKDAYGPGSEKLSFRHDAGGRLIGDWHRAYGWRVHRYDAGDRLIGEETGRDSLRYDYDELDRLTAIVAGGKPVATITYPDAHTRVERAGAHTRTVSQDDQGRVLRDVDSDSRAVSYNYDEAGRLRGWSASDGWRLNITCDGNGWAAPLAVALFTLGSGFMLLRYRHYRRGLPRVRTIFAVILLAIGAAALPAARSGSAPEDAINLSYSGPGGEQLTMRYAFSDSGLGITSSTGVEADFVIDEFGTVQRLSWSGPAGEVESASFDYGDGARIQTEIRNGEERIYNYDSQGRLTGEARAGSITHWNRTRAGRIYQRVAPDSADYGYDGSARLTSIGNRRFTHDDAGRLETSAEPGSRRRFHWDAAGYLTGAEVDGAPVKVARDAAGQMVSREFRGETVRCWWAGGVRHALSMPEGELRLLPGPGGRPLAAVWQGKIYLCAFNQRGDIISLLDEDGVQVNRYDYDVWGNPLVESEVVPFPIRFAGGYYDRDLGLYEFGSRWYDPRTGNFLSPDPIPDFTPYLYADGDPVNRVDPTGLAGENVFVPVRLANGTESIHWLQRGGRALDPAGMALNQGRNRAMLAAMGGAARRNRMIGQAAARGLIPPSMAVGTGNIFSATEREVSNLARWENRLANHIRDAYARGGGTGNDLSVGRGWSMVQAEAGTVSRFGGLNPTGTPTRIQRLTQPLMTRLAQGAGRLASNSAGRGLIAGARALGAVGGAAIRVAGAAPVQAVSLIVENPTRLGLEPEETPVSRRAVELMQGTDQALRAAGLHEVQIADVWDQAGGWRTEWLDPGTHRSAVPESERRASIGEPIHPIYANSLNAIRQAQMIRGALNTARAQSGNLFSNLVQTISDVNDRRIREDAQVAAHHLVRLRGQVAAAETYLGEGPASQAEALARAVSADCDRLRPALTAAGHGGALQAIQQRARSALDRAAAILAVVGEARGALQTAAALARGGEFAQARSLLAPFLGARARQLVLAGAENLALQIRALHDELLVAQEIVGQLQSEMTVFESAIAASDLRVYYQARDRVRRTLDLAQALSFTVAAVAELNSRFETRRRHADYNFSLLEDIAGHVVVAEALLDDREYAASEARQALTSGSRLAADFTGRAAANLARAREILARLGLEVPEEEDEPPPRRGWLDDALNRQGRELTPEERDQIDRAVGPREEPRRVMRLRGEENAREQGVRVISNIDINIQYQNFTGSFTMNLPASDGGITEIRGSYNGTYRGNDLSGNFNGSANVTMHGYDERGRRVSQNSTVSVGGGLRNGVATLRLHSGSTGDLATLRIHVNPL